MAKKEIPSILKWTFNVFNSIFLSIFIGVAASILVSFITSTALIDDYTIYYMAIISFSCYLFISSYLIYLDIIINNQFKRILNVWKEEIDYQKILNAARNHKSYWKWTFFFGVIISIGFFIYGLNLTLQINKQITAKNQTSSTILNDNLKSIQQSLTEDSLKLENIILLQKSSNDSLVILDNKILKKLSIFSGTK